MSTFFVCLSDVFLYLWCWFVVISCLFLRVLRFILVVLFLFELFLCRLRLLKSVWFDLILRFAVHRLCRCFLFLVSFASNSNLLPVAAVGLLLFCISLCLVLGVFVSLRTFSVFFSCYLCFVGSCFEPVGHQLFELCECSVTETTHILGSNWKFSQRENVIKHIFFSLSEVFPAVKVSLCRCDLQGWRTGRSHAERTVKFSFVLLHIINSTSLGLTCRLAAAACSLGGIFRAGMLKMSITELRNG